MSSAANKRRAGSAVTVSSAVSTRPTHSLHSPSAVRSLSCANAVSLPEHTEHSSEQLIAR